MTETALYTSSAAGGRWSDGQQVELSVVSCAFKNHRVSWRDRPMLYLTADRIDSTSCKALS